MTPLAVTLICLVSGLLLILIIVIVITMHPKKTEPSFLEFQLSKPPFLKKKSGFFWQLSKSWSSQDDQIGRYGLGDGGGYMDYGFGHHDCSVGGHGGCEGGHSG